MSERFTKLTSRTLVLPQANIDTDQIIPARFLTTTEREGLGAVAFYDWRYDADGAPNGDLAGQGRCSPAAVGPNWDVNCEYESTLSSFVLRTEDPNDGRFPRALLPLRLYLWRPCRFRW